MQKNHECGDIAGTDVGGLKFYAWQGVLGKGQKWALNKGLEAERGRSSEE